MSKNLDWIPFVADEWHQKTIKFTCSEKTYLFDIVLWQIKFNGEIPDDDTLKRLCYCIGETEIALLSACIAKYKLAKLHEYIKDLYDNQLQSLNKKKKAGRKGAAKRWKPDGSANGDANGTANDVPMPLEKRREEEIKEEEIKDTPLPPPVTKLVLPDWLPEKDWKDYSDWRKKQRGGFNQRMQELILDDLGKLKQQGHDPAAVLQQSLKAGWKSVHEIKENYGNQRNGSGNAKNSRHTLFEQQNYDAGTEGFGTVG